MSLEKLLALDVSGYTEKKEGLTYLSWANAWREFIRVYPDATYTIKMDESTGKCWFGDENMGYMVYTTVTANNLTHCMWLPVMDGKNKSMKDSAYTYKTKFGDKTVDPVSSFDVNKAVMRCLVKNLAMFGLGLYIYAGEDIPSESDPEETKYKQELKEVIDAGKVKILNQLIESTGTDVNEMLKYINSVSNSAVISVEELSLEQYNFVLKKLKEKSEKKK